MVRRRKEPVGDGPVRPDDARHVAVGEVLRPHGLRGELRVKLYNPDSELLLARPPMRLRLPDGSLKGADIEHARPVPGAVLLRLSGAQDRDGAEQLRGAQLEVPRETLGELDQGEYFVCDLEGCRVALDGKSIGLVRRVLAYPSCDVLVVARAEQSDLEVPMHADYIAAVEVGAGRIDLRTIEGLD